MTRRNLAHIASMAFNEPLLLEPTYARVFFSALGKEVGIKQLILPDEQIDASGMDAITTGFMAAGGRGPRSYQVMDGIAVLPVTGTLVHKLGTMRPYSGMTGYDGIIARLEQAIADPEVSGVMLDIDSPGGQVAGAFDCADVIARLGEEKPIWALSNDMACSAAMLIASACGYRLCTQTGRMGSVGVLMAHTSYAGALEKMGQEVTLIYAGNHKVDGNPYEALPGSVRAEFQTKMDTTRQMFAGKVSGYTGMSIKAVLDTEAAVYDGEAAVMIGFAHQIVNSADAINVMSAALKSNSKGLSMSNNTTALQERQRVTAILSHPEASGRQELAGALIMHTDMSAEQAGEILKLMPAAPDKELSAQIMDKELSGNHTGLATVLCSVPGMTLSKATEIIKAAESDADMSGGSAFERFMASESAEAAGADYADGDDGVSSFAMLLRD